MGIVAPITARRLVSQKTDMDEIFYGCEQITPAFKGRPAIQMRNRDPMRISFLRGYHEMPFGGDIPRRKRQRMSICEAERMIMLELLITAGWTTSRDGTAQERTTAGTASRILVAWCKRRIRLF